MRKTMLAIVGAVLLAGCHHAKVLRPDAAPVRLTATEPGKECSFLGDVTGGQGNWFSGALTSNNDLETGARNDLKNKAAAMGGNVIFLLTQRAGQTGGLYGGGQQTNVTLTGNVYKCPS